MTKGPMVLSLLFLIVALFTDHCILVREKTKNILDLLNSPSDLKQARLNRGHYDDRLRHDTAPHGQKTSTVYASATSDRDEEDFQVRQAMEESKNQFEAEQRRRRQRYAPSFSPYFLLP